MANNPSERGRRRIGANVAAETYRNYLACRAVTGQGPVSLGSSILTEALDEWVASLSESQRCAAYLAADEMLATEDRKWQLWEARDAARRAQ